MPSDAGAREDSRSMSPSILLRALRWRRLGAWSFFVVAIAAIAGSAIGPLFLRAADDSSLTNTLRQSASSARVSLISSGGAAQFRRVRVAAGVVGHLDGGRWFSAPVLSVDAGVVVDGGLPQLYQADLLARSGVCARIHFVAGSCPRAIDDVAMSTRSAKEAAIHYGQVVAITRPTASTVIRVRVVGIYDPPATIDDAYWGDINYFVFGQGSVVRPQLDPLITDDATTLSSVALHITPQLSADLSIQPGAVRANVVGTLELNLHSVFGELARRYSLAGTTPLFSLFGGVAHTENLMTTVVEVAVLQLLLLTLLILYFLVGLSGRDRQLEIEIARRHGFPRRSLLLVAVGEPVVLLTAALPLGLLAAWAAVAAGRSLFATGTPVALTGAGIGTALIGYLGGILAAIVASWGLWQGPGRIRERQSRRRSATAATDAIAVALAASGLIALSAGGALGGSPVDPIALVAPGLLAIGAGVIGLRLAGLAMRAMLRPSRESYRVAWFLTVRELARRQPSALRQLLPTSVAVGLVVFAVCSWALATTNRSTLASFENGAARVVDVNVRPGVNLVDAVRAADPSGRSAMAAAVYRSQSGALLAVDASRLAAVATWPAGLTSRSATEVGHYLSPATLPPIEFVGGSLRATIVLPPGAPSIDLSATVFNETSQDQSTIDMGTLRPGTGSYIGSLQGFCASTCRLVNLSPTAPSASPGARSTVHMTVETLAIGSPGESWRNLPFGAGHPRSWSAVPAPAAVITRRATTGVSFSLPAQYLDTQAILLAPADVPNPVPAVVTDTFASVNAPAPPDDAQTVDGLDGGSFTAAGEIAVPALPEMGSDAALADLSFAQLLQTGPSHATFQVWLSGSAPPSIFDRLRALGVTVRSSRSAVERSALLDEGPLALAYRFVLYSSPVGGLLAIGAGAFGLLATGRRRRTDLRSLTVVGITQRTVVRSIVLESGIVLGVALLVGALAGVAATQQALSSLPEFPHGAGGVPLSDTLPLAQMFAVVVIMAIVLTLTAVTTTFLIFGGSAREPTAVEES